MFLKKFKIKTYFSQLKNIVYFSASYTPDKNRSGYHYNYEYNITKDEFSSNIGNGVVSDEEKEYLMQFAVKFIKKIRLKL